MSSIAVNRDRTRQEQVLAVALEVFGRYGFRKTSMDEVARAADISRQGLYSYFANKEALFRAAVRQELDTALGDVAGCLDQEDGLERRVVAALDAWLGRYVGSMLATDIGNLLHNNPAMHLGELVDPASAEFDDRLAAAIAAAMSEKGRTRPPVTPQEIAAALHLVAQGAKYLSNARIESREEFVARLTTGVRVVFAGLEATAE